MKHIEKIVIGMIAVLSVLIVIIATDFWLLWLPLAHSSEYPQKVAALFMALTALVTLLVVYATFNATKQSNLRELTRRKDEIEKENRDRKERLLNEIIEWAVDVAKCGSTVNIPPSQPFFSILYEKTSLKLSQGDKEKLLEGIKKDDDRRWLYRHMEAHSKYQIVDARGEYIVYISEPFKEIILRVNEVKSKIREYLDVHWDFMKNINDEKMMGRVIELEHRLEESAVTLIEEAAKIKTKDIS